MIICTGDMYEENTWDIIDNDWGATLERALGYQSSYSDYI